MLPVTPRPQVGIGRTGVSVSIAASMDIVVSRCFVSVVALGIELSAALD